VLFQDPGQPGQPQHQTRTFLGAEPAEQVAVVQGEEGPDRLRRRGPLRGEPELEEAPVGRVPDALALDVSPAMIETARRVIPAGARITAEVGDVAALPYRDGSVDLAVSTLSLHHWPDLAGAVRELARVRAPGGRVWIYDLRRALRSAQVAAGVAFPGLDVRVEPVRAGLLGRFLARLTVEPVPVAV
jgi:SAM-dependent methyltransferase